MVALLSFLSGMGVPSWVRVSYIFLVSISSWIRQKRLSHSSLSVDYRIGTVLFTAAGLAFEASPHGVKLVHRGFDQVGLVGEDAGLEVAGAAALHAEAGACEVGGTDIGKFEVEDDYLEMNTRAEDSL